MCVSGRRAVCAQYKRPESEAVGKRVVRACTSTRPVKGKGGGYGTAKKKLHSYAEKPTPMYFFRRESKKRNEKNSENPVPARPSLSISCPVSTAPNRNRPTHTPPPWDLNTFFQVDGGTCPCGTAVIRYMSNSSVMYIGVWKSVPSIVGHMSYSWGHGRTFRH